MKTHIHKLPSPPEKYETDLIDRLHPEIIQYSEMASIERYFLNGLVRLYRPRKIVEIGVSAGASSCIFLNAIQDMAEARLVSIDLAKKWYRDESKETGWLGTKYFKAGRDWELVTGNDPVEVMEGVGGQIDFCFIDTAHVHPVEVLNFLTVLPFLTRDAVVVVHDISLYAQSALVSSLEFGGQAHAYACRHLYDLVAADRLMPEEGFGVLPNIGAFQINPDTRRYIDGMFGSLCMRWFVPVHENARLVQIFKSYFEKYYGGQYGALFQMAIDAQSEITKVGDMHRDNLECLRRVTEMAQEIISDGYDTVMLFGTGTESRRMFHLLKMLTFNIHCITDISSDEKERDLDGIKIHSLEDVAKSGVRIPFVIASFDSEEINESYQAISRCFLE